MKYFLPILVSGLCVIFCACKENMLRGEGAKGSITPSVSSFSGLDVSMSAKVVVNVQEVAQPAVRVSGFENVLKYVRADVSGNVLHIHFDNTGFRSFQYDDMTIEVTMPAINSLSLSGAPDAEIHGNVTGRALNISVSGSSSVDIDNLNTDNFSMDISGSGALNIKGGHVKSASYQVSGSGDVSAFPLQSDRTEASISGSGSGKVTALQSLSANISGSGSISYKGHPSVSQHVSGTGSIMDAN